MKTRTIIFGAGAGARQFLVNQAIERDFLAVADNDVSRHGTLFEGQVIVPPESIRDYEFDEIVITTQWAAEVRRQLTEDLGIDASRVIIPAKSLLKKPQPFYHPQTRELARTIIRNLSREAAERDITLFLDFGTLLGLVRDRDVIEWDDDVDFAADVNDADRIEEWLRKTVQHIAIPVQFCIQKTVDSRNRPGSFLLQFNQDPFISFTTSISFRKKVNERSVHLPSLGQWYAPHIHFDRSQTMDWGGVALQLPYRPEEYLDFLYGDWRTPKKNITMADYQHLGQVDFDEFKEQGFQAHTIAAGDDV